MSDSLKEIVFPDLPIAEEKLPKMERSLLLRKRANDFLFALLKKRKYITLPEDSKIKEKDLADLARALLKARYKDDKLAKIVEMILANAGNYLSGRGLFDIRFGIPLFGDGDIGKEGPVQLGEGNLNPKFKLLLHYEDAVTKFLDDTLFWAQGKPILGLLSTELMWKYTVFDGIVIIFLLYHLIYADNSKESAEQVDPFEDLLKAYKNKLVDCFDIVPILSVLPPPPNKEKYKGDGVRAKQVKERLESIQVD